MRAVRVTGVPSPIAWWNGTVGQVSRVLEVYEPTGFMKVCLMFPVYWVGAIDTHYQVCGWIDPEYVEDVK